VAEALAAQTVPPPRATRQENLQHSLLQGHASRPRQSDSAPRIVPQIDDEVVRRPPFLLAILFAPFNMLYKLFSTSFGLFSFLFPFLPRALRPVATAGTARRANTAGRRSLKPRDASVRLKREFEEEYGSNTLPFFDGGYAQALDLAKKDLKFLLIILLSPEHDDTSSFIRDTLLSAEIQAFINDPSTNIILWTGDVRDSEAYQVSSALHCNKFPFTAVVANDPSVSSTNMSVIARVTGPMDASTYLAKIRNTISTHGEQLARVRASRSAQNFERTLRQEQDSAYERSLAQDRERARLKKEAEAAAKEEERRKKAEAEAAETLAKKKLQWRKWRASRIDPEPSADTKDVVRIAMKMPEHLEAARVTRRFKGQNSIEELYAFVECYEFLKDGSASEEVSKPEGYEHEFDFRLVQTLPRVVYEISEGGTIGERVGRSGNLIVEPIKGDEDEE
jgi:FAS-associated factor 2